MNSAIGLRSASPQDEPFLAQVYGSTRAEELAATSWGIAQKEAFIQMQYQAQRRYYTAEFPSALQQIILVAGKPAGRLYVDRAGDSIHILDITVIPEHRNQGIGRELLEELMRESAQTGKPLNIYVETFNRSLSLFERLGFRKAKETGIHYFLEWTKPAD
jgi:ribosomal protein S18 acetylase RimI-like enzyme